MCFARVFSGYLEFRSYLKANYPKSLPFALKSTLAFEIHWVISFWSGGFHRYVFELENTVLDHNSFCNFYIFCFYLTWGYLSLLVCWEEWNEKPAKRSLYLLMRKGSVGRNTLFDLAGEVTVTFLSYGMESNQPTNLTFGITFLKRSKNKTYQGFFKKECA